MKPPSVKGLKARLWKEVTHYIKQEAKNQDDYVECYTCDKVLLVGSRDCQVGHCFNKKAYPYLFYNLDNMRIQCYYCNNFKQGDAINFAVRLIDEIGIRKVAALWYNRQNPYKRDVKWYQEEIKRWQMLATQTQS